MFKIYLLSNNFPSFFYTLFWYFPHLNTFSVNLKNVVKTFVGKNPRNVYKHCWKLRKLPFQGHFRSSCFYYFYLFYLQIKFTPKFLLNFSVLLTFSVVIVMIIPIHTGLFVGVSVVAAAGR